ncbi:MAG: LptF/LptG family permease [bacterium]
MLKILPKYILREHIGPFVFALAVINSVFILNLLFKQLGKFLSKSIPLPVIMEFLFLNLAWMIALSVPMAVLTATMMAFGRLSAEHEITAVKASGVSLTRILLFVLAMAFLLCCGLIWFNNHVLPDFNHRARLLAVDIARKKPMINLDSGVLYTDIPGYSILVQNVVEKGGISYVDTIIIDDQSERNVIKTITASKGELLMDEKTGVLEITLFDGEVHEVDIHRAESFKKLEFPKHILKIPMTESLLRRTASGYRGDREKSAAALMEGVLENRKRIAERKRKITEMMQKKIEQYALPDKKSRLTLPRLIRDQEQLQRQVQSELSMIDSYERSSNVYLVEYYKKYSIPAACVVFILVGAPLGILTRQRGWALAAVLSIGFFLLYWAFLIAGEILADRQKLSPFWAMWSPNALVGGCGILLVFRVVRETTFFPWRWRPAKDRSVPGDSRA